jgi:hypothetical protein
MVVPFAEAGFRVSSKQKDGQVEENEFSSESFAAFPLGKKGTLMASNLH